MPVIKVVLEVFYDESAYPLNEEEGIGESDYLDSDYLDKYYKDVIDRVIGRPSSLHVKSAELCEIGHMPWRGNASRVLNEECPRCGANICQSTGECRDCSYIVSYLDEEAQQHDYDTRIAPIDAVTAENLCRNMREENEDG